MRVIQVASSPFRSVSPSRVILMLLSLMVATFTAVSAIPSVPVDSFSFSDLDASKSDTVTELVATLEAKGIVSIRDVPQYAMLRRQLLYEATVCVSKAKSTPGVQEKTLRDGTRRVTISTKSQLNHPDVAQSTVADACPHYLPVLRAFSELLNIVAKKVATTIDGTATGEKKMQSLGKIVGTAQHLDHLHSYSSPSTASKPAKDDEDVESAVLSLDLHTDNGVMILMTTPEFFTVEDGETPRRVPRDAIKTGLTASAGLLIKQPHQKHVVQPVLKDDEVIIMVGEGYRSWMHSSLDFKPVLHGMQMPQFSSVYGKISRTWFGKMILLPKTEKLKNSAMTFGEYAEKSTQYVLGREGTEAFSSVACPPNSRLVESDKACALKLYEPRVDSRASREECMNMCNTHSDGECEELCEYVATVPNGGVDCWMLCLPKDECPSDQTAKCDPSGAQKTVCVPEKPFRV